MTQSSQKYLISDDCDYDRTPHKMVTTLFLRIAIMITVLINCTIYEDCDHDRGPHKNIIFLGFYMIAIIITVFFIRIAIMIAVCIKMSYIWVFMRTATIIVVLKRTAGRSAHKMPYFWVFVRIAIKAAENRDSDHSPHKMRYFWLNPHRGLRLIVTILISLVDPRPLTSDDS